VPIVSVVFGALLTALGLWGWFGAEPEHRSVTAFIPAFLGLLALKESMLKHAMHAAAALGLLGFLAALGRIIQKLATGGTVEGRAGTSTVLMAVLCGVFVALCVNSFIQARRRRRAAAGAALAGK
jgi:hypothetical protein